MTIFQLLNYNIFAFVLILLQSILAGQTKCKHYRVQTGINSFICQPPQSRTSSVLYPILYQYFSTKLQKINQVKELTASFNKELRNLKKRQTDKVLRFNYLLLYNIKRTVMNKQIAGLFDRFYNIALKDKIQDPLLQSEWNYFQSMLASSNFQRERINMYLSILEKQKRKKQSISQFQFGSLGFEPKMEKRFSQPVKNNQTISQIPIFQAKQQDNGFESTKNAKMMTPKSKQPPKKFQGWDSKERSGNNSSNSKGAQNQCEQKPNYKRLCETANSLVRLFQISVMD